MNDLVADIARLTGHRFSDARLLRLALTHTSYDGDQRGRAGGTKTAKSEPSQFERMEFLGDRVLGLVVAEMLLTRFPNEAEGDLARRHVALVHSGALTRVAKDMQLCDFLRLSHGEQEVDTPGKDAILADATEALIGAIYVDGGLQPASDFIHRYWEKYLDEHLQPPQDPKTALQEWAQARGMDVPSYTEVKRDGPDHAPEFTIAVQVGDLAPVTATGGSKRKAEKAAAAVLLQQLAQGEGGSDGR